MAVIVVTKHAIDQARTRVWGWDELPEPEIINQLTGVAEKGRKTRNCPGSQINIEVEYNDIYVVVRDDPRNGDKVVVTTLGDSQYHHWLRTEKRNELERKGHFRSRKGNKPARAL